MKTRENVEELKQTWLSDPCWDIEDTIGFESFQQELIDFRFQEELINSKADSFEHSKKLVKEIINLKKEIKEIKEVILRLTGMIT